MLLLVPVWFNSVGAGGVATTMPDGPPKEIARKKHFVRKACYFMNLLRLCCVIDGGVTAVGGVCGAEIHAWTATGACVVDGGL